MADRDPLNQLIAYAIIKNAAKAIDFYKAALGAEERVGRMELPDGRVSHAELRFGNTTLYLADEHPEYGYLTPDPSEACPVSFMLQVDDVDAAVARALEAGATLSRQVEDQFYGHRTGEIRDGFGYRWTLSTKTEDVSEEELKRRAAKLHEDME